MADIQVTYTLTNGTSVPAIQNDEGIWISSNGGISFNDNVQPTQQYIDKYRPAKTNAQKLSEIKLERDRRLKQVDWLVIRHYSQKVKTLTNEQFEDLQDYMQALRDMPETTDLDNPVYPVLEV
jgi:predicted DNA-binding helix-hairpin-helix protein